MRSQFLSVLVLAMTVGCAGYKLGPAGKTDYHSVAVKMFKNRTYQPQLEAQVSNAIIKRFQHDATLSIRSTEDADIILAGEIIEYRRHLLRGDRYDTTVPSEFRLLIEVRVRAYNRATGVEVLSPTTFTGQTDTFIGADQQSAEKQALPLIANDLAKKIVSRLAEPW